MPTRSLIWLSTTVALTFLLSGCTSSDETGCATDQQCKADRICNTAGRCVWPSGGGPDDSDASEAGDAVTSPDSGPDADAGESTPDIGDHPDAPRLDTGVDADPDADALNPDASDCRVASIRAQVQGEDEWHTSSLSTQPLVTVKLDASPSSGAISRYEWTILERPQGATQRLTPDSAYETPYLFLDLPGVYRVQLEVHGTAPQPDCPRESTATFEIVASAQGDLQIKLLWDTPADPDQTDDFGSDLDLHYLHESGRWNDPPWDIFWRNSQADWGVQDDASDDPSLDIDDTDGAGPELLNHSGLEDVTYSVGAYYYSDSTLGASYATVRIYVQGQLEYEVEDKYMPATGSFWDVARIEDLGATITDVSKMYQGFP